ncbi:hypothetical protein [Methylobacterium oryzisoli]|uniref:hypothetical protein n=1 Tax=Methylobacterium oryzisoli TaxID=3385502 RepID=UPI0038915344
MKQRARETLPAHVADAQAAVRNVGAQTACGLAVLLAVLLGTTVVDAGRREGPLGARPEPPARHTPANERSVDPRPVPA